MDKKVHWPAPGLPVRGPHIRKDSGLLAAKEPSEHEQRARGPLRKTAAHRGSLTAAVHALTSLIIRDLAQNRGYYTILPENVKPSAGGIRRGCPPRMCLPAPDTNKDGGPFGPPP